MVATLAEKWWLFLVQGILMILLAVLAFTQPWTVIGFIGAYAVIDGIFKLVTGLVRPPDEQSRWPILLIGVISIVAGLIIWFNPAFAAAVLVYVIAAWAIIVGILLALWAFRLRQDIDDEWTLLLLALLSIVFGVLVFANVQDGMLALRSIFSGYMLIGGILAIILALRVRSVGERLALGR